MFYFRVYGITCSSSIPLNGFPQLSPQDSSNPQIEIKQASVSPHGLRQPTTQGLLFQVNEHELWLSVPNIARFLVQEGQCILFDPDEAATPAALALFLRGPCLAALLIQRDLLVFSGSAYTTEQGAVAYLGENSCGKSSLLACAVQQGYSLLSDGLCVISSEGFVLPGTQKIYLWEDRLEEIHLTQHALEQVVPDLKQYAYSIPQHYCSHPVPLHKAMILSPKKSMHWEKKNLSGSEKIKYLQKNIYNKTYLDAFNKHPLYFSACVRLAQQIQMTLIEFNGTGFMIQDLNAYIKETGHA